MLHKSEAEVITRRRACSSARLKNILTIEVADFFFAGCPKDDLGHFDYKCNCSLAGNATVGFIREFIV